MGIESMFEFLILKILSVNHNIKIANIQNICLVNTFLNSTRIELMRLNLVKREKCVFAKNGKNPKTKADEIQYTTEKCSLNMEKIRNLASYCATKGHAANKEFEDLMYKNRNSLNKNKLAANFKVNYDAEYKRLRDIALGDNIEVISSIDLIDLMTSFTLTNVHEDKLG
jgi:hypothetical protein